MQRRASDQAYQRSDDIQSMDEMRSEDIQSMDEMRSDDIQSMDEMIF